MLVLGLFGTGVGVAGALAQVDRRADEPALASESAATAAISEAEIDSALRIVAESDAFTGLDPGLGRVLSVENPRPFLIEGERRGVTFVWRLDEPTKSDGPWIEVDRGALLAERGAAPEGLDHDGWDAALAGIEIKPDDYKTRTETYGAEVDAIYVAVDLVRGEVLFLRPNVDPPEPAPRNAEEARVRAPLMPDVADLEGEGS